MLLHDYFTKFGIQQKAFAERCGVTPATINSISRGRRKTNAPLALRIEKLTDGHVDPYSIIEEYNKERLDKARDWDMNFSK
jgi:plasmid maintenance system antidote protein VapI